ncbi:uncharacterized protein LOC107498715 isoform X4 [Rousettus aegyptiacus]|uniref:uncharacterized protein LOC107498715 isoform X4 n=1 Tax=Rousettus aegyptiacus TaxID=9407 RepID=UPI000789A41E|nr:uncharacterized protein LOC107498715 isoform X4 [Rousettus aegyptiacus]
MAAALQVFLKLQISLTTHSAFSLCLILLHSHIKFSAFKDSCGEPEAQEDEIFGSGVLLPLSGRNQSTSSTYHVDKNPPSKAVSGHPNTGQNSPGQRSGPSPGVPDRTDFENLPAPVSSQTARSSAELQPAHPPPTVCFPASLSFGEAPTPEAQGSEFPVPRMAAGRAQTTTPTRVTFSTGFTRSWESVRERQGQLCYLHLDNLKHFPFQPN